MRENILMWLMLVPLVANGVSVLAGVFLMGMLDHIRKKKQEMEEDN